MSQKQKLLSTVLGGMQDRNIPFSELCLLLSWLRFECRVKGDHFIYTRQDVEEILNLQSKDGKAKPYQVKQVRNVIVKYRLGGELDA